MQLKVQYNPKNRLSKAGYAPVYIFAMQSQQSNAKGDIIRKRQRLLIPTGIHLKPVQWLKKHNKVAHHPDALLLNEKIITKLSQIQRYCIQVEMQKGTVTIQDLKNYISNGDLKSFLEFWKVEMDNDKTVGKWAMKNLKKAYNHLSRFRKDIAFSDLTYKLISDFDNLKRSEGLKTNTVAELHARIKRMINLAIKKGLFDMSKNPYLNFKIKKEPTTRVVLEKHELTKLDQCKFEDKYKTLPLIRDTFLFQCYTGLRYDDLYNLTVSNIKKGNKGLELHLIASKTKKELRHQLSEMFGGKPAELAERYMKHKTKTDKLLHVPSNQKYNKRLKDLAKVADIDKNLTSHVARHTFATLLLTAGVPVVYVQKLLQHSKLATTQIYEHINKNDIYDKLGEIDWD